ncbi:tRNA_anti-like [Rhodoferax sp. OV413]|uniref:OB-fold protein n=1 Tax=Rhodoferax sp. OV413 TaxID=1855285 RepID=UPI0008807EF8|nr:hypothetical protein [Rhodoferax sp. OV413]SDP87724.1 tRNA_anti-like [Rhodoferax sp. OV413]
MSTRASIRPRRIAASLALSFLACNAAFAGNARTYETPEAEKFVRNMVADADAGKTIRLNGQTLMQAYKSSETAADKKYKGKTLLVETAVDLVSRDMFGALVVYLKSGSFMPIAARFDKKVTLVEGMENDTGSIKIRQLPAEEAAALLKRGQTIHLVCKGDGYNLGSPGLELCNVVSL